MSCNCVWSTFFSFSLRRFDLFDIQNGCDYLFQYDEWSFSQSILTMVCNQFERPFPLLTLTIWYSSSLSLSKTILAFESETREKKSWLPQRLEFFPSRTPIRGQPRDIPLKLLRESKSWGQVGLVS